MIAAEKPDLVHAQFGKFNALLAAIAVGRVPLVITFRGSDINVNPQYSRLRSSLGLMASHLASLQASAVVCVSREIASKLVFRPKCLEVLPSGVDTAAFHPSDRKAARLALGWPLDRPTVLFNAGSNPKIKNLPLAEAVVAWARRQVPALEFVVLRGDLDPERMPLAMAAADCLLVTSLSEGSPTVVQEAMACDLPVVTVPVGDVRERLQGVEHSVVVEGGVPELGAALVNFLKLPRWSNGSRRLGAAALDQVAQGIESIYYKSLRQSPGSPG